MLQSTRREVYEIAERKVEILRLNLKIQEEFRERDIKWIKEQLVDCKKVLSALFEYLKISGELKNSEEHFEIKPIDKKKK